MKLEELKKRAREHDMIIRKYERGEDSYILVDARLNAAVSPDMTLEQLETWLDDLDRDNAE